MLNNDIEITICKRKKKSEISNKKDGAWTLDQILWFYHEITNVLKLEGVWPKSLEFIKKTNYQKRNKGKPRRGNIRSMK